MNSAIAVGIASGLLQFGLACYAFRFARHLGKSLIGWFLFITLSFLAICTPLLSAKLHFEHVETAPGVNILYTAFSFFLFLGLARFDRSLRKYRRMERYSRGAEDDEVEELTRAKVELERRAGGLEKEVFEENEARKRLEESYKDLVFSIGTRMPVIMDRAQPELALQAEEPKAVPQPEPALQAQPVAQPEPAAQPEISVQPALVPGPEPVVISLPPSMIIPQTEPVVIRLPESVTLSQPEPAFLAEAASLPESAPVPELEQQQIQPPLHEDVGQPPEFGVLVNHVTASVTSLAEHLARCERASASFSRLAKLVTTHARNLGTDARGKQFPASLAQLSKQLADEQTFLAKQIGLMKKRLTEINSALTIVLPTVPDPIASASMEFQGEEQFHYSLNVGQTETAVSSETESEQDGSTGTVVHEATLDGEEDEANVLPEDGGDTGFIFR